MPLDVIGAGFGRTGTSSIRAALEQLGLPCYHMASVLFDPRRKSDVDFWLEVAEAPEASHDWERVFGDLRATVDFPACTVWRQLARDYPEAKVLLTQHPRGAESWYASTHETIYTGTGHDANTEFGEKINRMMDKLVWHGELEGAMEDRERAIAIYERREAELRAELPDDRILVFSADQGWEPLCDFLGLPVPDGPFPQVNERAEMARMTARLERMKAWSRAKAS